jgi:hypothetical protein
MLVVLVVMLAGCDGCGGDGITVLPFGDAGFDIRRDGGLDGLDDLLPDGGVAGATGATGGFGAIGTAGVGVAGTPAGAAGAAAGTGAGFGPIGGSWGGSGGFFGTGGVGFPRTGGSGGSTSDVRCDIYSTCWYPDGQVCDQFGFCCTPDASERCCQVDGCKPTPMWNTPPVPQPTVDEPWQPALPAEDLGAPGWRNSTETFCTGRLGNTYAHSVWSDSRGVYVAAINDGYNDTNCPSCIDQSIFFNDGTGWTMVPGSSSSDDDNLYASGQLTLTGFDNGPLMLYGYGAYDLLTGQSCGLMLIDGDTRVCEPVEGISDVHVVSSTLAYGVMNGTLIRYDGERWGPVPSAAPTQNALHAVWANDTVIMATGQQPGTIYSLRNGTWFIEDTRTLDYFSAIWGFAANDVWAGTAQGTLYHYDGTTWTEIEWPGGTCNFGHEIIGMWGAGGVVYFHSTSAIGRWNGTQAETIAEWSCDTSTVNANITSVWGNSATEVFFSVVDHSYPTNSCGTTFVMYYDGTLFHPM